MAASRYTVTKTDTRLTVEFHDIEELSLDTKWCSESNMTKLVERDSEFKPGVDTILFASQEQGTYSALCSNGVLGAIIKAYSCHVPLTLRPDDIWASICSSFANYVNANAEQMRHLFVDHEGKKELMIHTDGSIAMTDEKQWRHLIGEMVKLVKQNVVADITDWFTPSFTTTTELDIMLANLFIMAATKKYFTFGMTMDCGLAKLNLEGTADDWIALRHKAAKLASFPSDTCKPLVTWSELLLPVLDQFVQLFTEGSTDPDFWQRICTYKSRGSGGEKEYRGWFLVFAPFAADGKLLLRDPELVKQDNVYGVVNNDDLPKLVVNVPVRIDDNGNEVHTVFSAGVPFIKYQNGEISPSASWSIVAKKEITGQNMIEYANTCIDMLPSYSKSRFHNKLLLIQLVRFADHLANCCEMPNDKLFLLVDVTVWFHLNSVKSSTVLDRGLLTSLVASLNSKMYIDGTSVKLGKYITDGAASQAITDFMNRIETQIA